MQIYDVIYISYEIINEYLNQIRLVMDEDVWLEMMIISFINKNIYINLYHFINYFTRRMDLLILFNNQNDIDHEIEIPRKIKFKINLLCRRIMKKMENNGLKEYINKK